jgi:restriction endonuclease Mrr
MRPVLVAHDDGSQIRLEEILDRVAPAVGVSEEERAQRQQSGDLVFAQRIGWARNYLTPKLNAPPPARHLSISGFSAHVSCEGLLG